ncbi:hypothetical protein GIY23_19760 [Allosaccharopolyspora coralli]|uniref:Uncharacterized protein n=1 Tax=Allosaccharopolyspora coralli TaxID=2665642 RepID=A0A5Q3QA58_9PSEU|nr:hypothetical protein [Allosaccharopolyspora coralli]QGK71448.1 hypothetical protein GIY23_19760 [Allosaccharopolyspora coralli]
MQDRPSGKRRSRGGAVTVPQLLQRRPGSLRGADFDLDPDDPLVDGASAGRVPAQRSRAVMGVVAVVLLLLVSVAVSVVTARATSAGPPPRAVASAPISGVDALRLDLLRQARWPFHDLRDRTVGDPRVGSRGQGHAHDPGAANPAAGSADSARALVAEFYRLMDTRPQRALDLVAPELLNGERSLILAAWEPSSVRVQHLDVRSANSVVAEIGVDHPGGHTALRHRLTVEEGARPHILAIDLLTARHHGR